MALVILGAGGVVRGEEPPLPSTADVKELMEAGKYREALKPLFRLLALKGPAAIGYDRWELLMLRAECQLQIHEQQAVLETLQQAREEAFTENKPARAAEPTALTLLVQRSSAFHYKSKSDPGDKPIPILDRTLRPAAYAALLVDELPPARQKVKALNNARTIAPVLEAARVVGAVHAVEIIAKPAGPDGQAAIRETDPLVSLVTTNADRLFSGAIADMAKTADAITKTANEIFTDQVGHYDPVSGKAWFEPVTRRRGVTDQGDKALTNITNTCDKIDATIVDLAVALAADFDAYRAMQAKTAELKKQVAAIRNENYMVVPP